jgi:molybdopterin synthase catalytic subunit
VSAHKVVLAEISAGPLDTATHLAAVAHPAAGATVGFSGVVRDHDNGRSVHELEYVAHPSADEILAEIAAEIAALEHVESVAVSHRIGLLRVGDVALAAAVSTAHRAEAYEACSRLVEEVKARVPIWKRQRFAEGDEEWVACP